jgi:peptide deformylase
MISILQKEEKVLHKKARAVPLSKISSKETQGIISRMKEALDSQHDGVAIAAPQIGESVRIFVVSGKIFDEDFKRGRGLEQKKKINEDVVFINPVFTKKSKEKKFMPEGCLSVRWIYGKVERSTRATVKAYDEKGEEFTRGAGGLLAQIFQHEIDHLDGILFIDKATEIEEANPEEYYAKQ